ncbi:MAG: OmpA family protein [Myxococcales bacterium]|jgi:OOP family OmpA-OmpF porin
MRLARFGVIALALATLASGCVSGNKIRASGEVIQADIQRARKSGAYRCAPRELALAEAHLDFAYGEVSEGNSTRAQEHIVVAEENIKKALVLSKGCGPKQVLIKEKKEPVVVKIEPTDRDGDGVLDADDECIDVPGPAENKGCPWPDTDNDGVIDPEDQCPEVPGPAENKGCPVIRDTDGDGIPDDLDRCPVDPEDKDGFQDEDGCPELDNDQDGITDQMDGCPMEPGPMENRGCPIRDRDGDGIFDHLDKCPDEAEDKDGYEDEDGCPDLDNDKDGIADAQDACPLEPGVAQDDPKQNGCPRKMQLVVVKKDKIEIKQQINFQSGKAKIIGKRSFQILDEVVQVLNDYPSIKKIRVEGHTDSVGSNQFNQRLSQARADSVVEYLLSQGVSPERIEAVGYGEERPIQSNATAKGRAANRRTEFNIVERD